MVDFEKDIEQSLAALKSGGLILYPTDTIWGIGCDATNAKAVEKVYALKQRPDSKALIVLAADERQVMKYVSQVDLRVFDYLDQTIIPTTVVYEGAIGLASNLGGKDGSIAIRICKDPFCKALIKRFGKPIVSTSANISGEQSPANFNEVNRQLFKGVDHIVKHRQDDHTPAEASTVIRWTKNGKPEILRK